MPLKKIAKRRNTMNKKKINKRGKRKSRKYKVSKRKMRNKSNKRRKSLKGGALPFSELGAVYGRTIDTINQSFLPITGDNTPESRIVSSDPTRGHFTQSNTSISETDVGPDLEKAFSEAYPST